jgi:two-component system, OmpR family, osmolarity sensor histidine kinase EnvZ
MKIWNPFRQLKRFLPHGLFGRSLLIVVLPMMILQGIVTYFFFVRHQDLMTQQMAKGTAADVAYLIDIVNHNPPGQARDNLLAMAAKNLEYRVSLAPGQQFAHPGRDRFTPHLKDAMNRVFLTQFGTHFPFHANFNGPNVNLEVQLKDGIMRLVISQKRLTATSASIFVVWMLISSLLLLGVAILFLRNQVRPIERLAFVAEAFGKGRAVPDFKPYGATEVRRAAQAFITMRSRIERYVQQRTEMLAGVSHDLKTPLTRMRLQLAMMGDGPETTPLQEDVLEMEHMLDEYLDFARGEGGEEMQSVDLAEFLEEVVATAQRSGSNGRLKIENAEPVVMSVRRQSLRRCVTNLIDNALKHGAHVTVGLHRNGRFVEIEVDDDGPGIPEGRREEAFRPFHRLDEGRNLQTGGVGLGLAIARDAARAHGGELALEDSETGGLRAVVRLPV